MHCTSVYIYKYVYVHMCTTDKSAQRPESSTQRPCATQRRRARQAPCSTQERLHRGALRHAGAAPRRRLAPRRSGSTEEPCATQAPRRAGALLHAGAGCAQQPCTAQVLRHTGAPHHAGAAPRGRLALRKSNATRAPLITTAPCTIPTLHHAGAAPHWRLTPFKSPCKAKNIRHIYRYVYIHMRKRTPINACTDTYVHMHMYMYIIYEEVSKFFRIRKTIYTKICFNIKIHMYIYKFTYIYVYSCIHVYMYIHTYIGLYRQASQEHLLHRRSSAQLQSQTSSGPKRLRRSTSSQESRETSLYTKPVCMMQSRNISHVHSYMQSDH